MPPEQEREIEEHETSKAEAAARINIVKKMWKETENLVAKSHATNQELSDMTKATKTRPSGRFGDTTSQKSSNALSHVGFGFGLFGPLFFCVGFGPVGPTRICPACVDPGFGSFWVGFGPGTGFSFFWVGFGLVDLTRISLPRIRVSNAALFSCIVSRASLCRNWKVNSLAWCRARCFDFRYRYKHYVQVTPQWSLVVRGKPKHLAKGPKEELKDCWMNNTRDLK